MERVGRPNVPEDKQLSMRVATRITKKQYNEFMKIARKLDLSTAELLRTSIRVMIEDYHNTPSR